MGEGGGGRGGRGGCRGVEEKEYLRWIIYGKRQTFRYRIVIHFHMDSHIVHLLLSHLHHNKLRWTSAIPSRFPQSIIPVRLARLLS